MMVSEEHWWDDTDMGKQDHSEKNLSQYCFVHLISQGLICYRVELPQ
jgi:hypothetical protein